jgi:elongation factor P
MSQAATNEVKPGMKVEVERDPYYVISNEFVKPGKGQAFNRIRLKNILTGRVVEKTFKSGDKLEIADVVEMQMRLLYTEGDDAIFMDDKTFDQVTVPFSVIGNNKIWLKEDVLFDMVFYKNTVVEIIPPTFMELVVTETVPGARGDTSGRVLKPATLETNAEIQVPIFINEEEKIKVDTRTAEYVSRV